jgi:hypothetical protein
MPFSYATLSPINPNAKTGHPVLKIADAVIRIPA